MDYYSDNFYVYVRDKYFCVLVLKEKKKEAERILVDYLIQIQISVSMLNYRFQSISGRRKEIMILD